MSADMSKDGTTTFVTESLVQQQIFNDTKVQTGIIPVRDQTISDFLAKPQLLEHVTWSTSEVQNTLLFSYSPEAALSAFPVYSEKIKGFNLARGTAVFRFVLSAEPFHQGKLIASFIPVHEQLANSKFRTSCLNQKTQQPNVEMDCRDATAIIKIPYIAPTDYYEISADTIGWGRLFLSVLSPLNTGSSGSNNVKVSVFISFEDFELAAPLFPQSSSVPKSKARPARSFSMSVQDREADIMAHGSISKGLLVAANLASSAASIPALTPLAEPASWLARALSHAASWFGWSKPQLDEPQNVVSRRLIPYMSNSTGASTAPKLALFHDNQLEVMPFMAGKDVDEMSFDYLKSIKAFCDRFTMTTSQSADTSLYTKSLVPTSFTQQVVFTGTTNLMDARSYPPFAYIARHFRYFRGGIRMHVKIAKTDYHSGRIAVVYSPKVGASSPATVEDATYSLREVIDIRGKSEFVLDLPYLINTPYVSVTESIGQVKFMVLNELRAPETCAQSIEFLVYYSACDDFEVQVPGSSIDTDDLTPRRIIPFYPQMGSTEADVNQEVVKEVIGNYPKPSYDLDPSLTCMGEAFTSVKNLMNRYTNLVSLGSLGTGTLGVSKLYPFLITGAYTEPTTQALLSPSIYGDALCDYAGGYAFYRGGVKIAVLGTSAPTRVLTTSTYNSPDMTAESIYSSAAVLDPGRSVGDPFTDQIGDLSPTQWHDGLGYAECAIPYQNRTHMTIIDPYDQSQSACPTGYSNPSTQLVYGWPGVAATPHKLMRSTSDEFQLAYFLGFPLVLSGYVPA